jgi:hypothetical protein
MSSGFARGFLHFGGLLDFVAFLLDRLLRGFLRRGLFGLFLIELVKRRFERYLDCSEFFLKHLLLRFQRSYDFHCCPTFPIRPDDLNSRRSDRSSKTLAPVHPPDRSLDRCVCPFLEMTKQTDQNNDWKRNSE